MYENTLGRRLLAITIPIESLVEVFTGRLILSLPKEIPEDAKYFASHYDARHQMLYITVTHPTFDVRDFDDPIRCVKVIPSVPVNQDLPDDTPGESVQGSEQCDRLV